MMHGLLLTALLALLAPQDDLFRQAKQAAASQDFERAFRLFQQVVESQPQNGEAHFFLAQLEVQRKNEREAIRHFERALELMPESRAVRKRYGEWLLYARYFEEAQRVYERLTQMAGDDPELWIQLGLARYQAGEPSAALLAYRQGLALQPDNARGHYLAAVAARSIGSTEESRQHVEEGLALKPGDAELSYQMAELLLESGDPQKSLPFWERLPEGDVRRHYGRAVALLRLGDDEQAEAALQQALKLDPQHAGAHYQMGLLCARSGRRQLSEQHFERFRQLEEQRRERGKVRESKQIVRQD